MKLKRDEEMPYTQNIIYQKAPAKCPLYTYLVPKFMILFVNFE